MTSAERKELIEWCADIAAATSLEAATAIRLAALAKEFHDESCALEAEIALTKARVASAVTE